jgi:hypothetical protein
MEHRPLFTVDGRATCRSTAPRLVFSPAMLECDGNASAGAAPDDPVPRTWGRVSMLDGDLATAVLARLIGNAAPGRWWADPAAGPARCDTWSCDHHLAR